MCPPAKRLSLRVREFKSHPSLHLILLIFDATFVSMKERFEIPIDSCSLSEIRDGNKVTYQTQEGDTVLSVTTSDTVSVDEITVSKYRNAKVMVIITFDHDDTYYKGVTP